MIRCTAVLVGIRPLLLANSAAADPLGETFEKLKRIRDKRRKTRGDYEALENILWHCQLYLNREGRIIMPILNFAACLVNAAAKHRLKDRFKSGIFPDAEDGLGWPIQYDGPQDLPSLRADPRFTLRRLVPNKKNDSRAPAVFPMLPTGWRIPIAFEADENVLNKTDIQQVMQTAGFYVGLGGWRPMFGRFAVEKLEMKP
jgi:hypothetical protein